MSSPRRYRLISSMNSDAPDRSSETNRRYLAMLTHDIQSALGGCIGALERLEGVVLDDASQQCVDGALVSALAASRLFAGAVDLDAIDNDQFSLKIDAIQANNLLSETYRRWVVPASTKGLALKIVRDAQLSDTIEVDRERLSRALGNVIENAIKYTSKGVVLVEARPVGKSGAVTFSVTDNGPGFSADALKRLFEFRGRPDNSAQPGSGLGLHIANLLVSQMGGTIDVENTVEAGAKVTISIPDVLPDYDTVVSENRPHNVSVSVIPSVRLPDLSQLNVLLAEDNATNQIVVTQMLDAMGAKFTVASDGVEALQVFEQQEFDLALLDIEMPRMSGLEVIRAIRSRRDDRANTPIVALTAYAMREHQEKISQAGADGLIAKPIMGIEELGEALLGYWRRRDVSLASEAIVSGPPKDLIDEAVFGALESSIGKSKMVELLGKVSQDLTEVQNGIQGGLTSKDSGPVRAASHVLISVAGAIGAISTQQLAERLNRSANAGDWPMVGRLGTSCLTRIDDLLTVLESRLGG